MKNKRLLPFAAVLTAAVMTLSGCYFFPDEEKLLDPPTISADAVTYSTFSARIKTIESAVNVTGYVKSRVEKECYFTAYTGRVKNVYVRAGDTVSEGDLIAEMNVGELEYELKIQELKVKAAKLRYNSTLSEQDRLQYEIENSTLEKYRAQIDGAKIYAPISGQVSYVFRINPGTELDPYKIVAKIVDPNDLYVEGNFDGDGGTFEKGDKVVLTVDGDTYDGTVSYTPKDAKADRADNLTLLQADFGEKKPSIGYIGAIANIRKTLAVSENALVIPKNLIKNDNGRTYVQVYENGEKTDRDVVLGITNATEAEILSGLSEGEAVIIK